MLQPYFFGSRRSFFLSLEKGIQFPSTLTKRAKAFQFLPRLSISLFFAHRNQVSCKCIPGRDRFAKVCPVQKKLYCRYERLNCPVSPYLTSKSVFFFPFACFHFFSFCIGVPISARLRGREARYTNGQREREKKNFLSFFPFFLNLSRFLFQALETIQG